MNEANPFVNRISYLMPHDGGERASLIVTILLVIVSMFLAIVANVPKGNKLLDL